MSKSKVVQEFKQFIMRGNVIDLAVGIIIGGAFSKIVTSVVSDVIMPPIGWLIGGVDFSQLKVVLPANPLAPEGTVPAAIAYGAFIQNIIDYRLGCIFIDKSYQRCWSQEKGRRSSKRAACTSCRRAIAD